MTLREILNAGKACQTNIMKRIDKKNETEMAQQTNQFIGLEYKHKVIECINDNIISFYNSNIREQAQQSTHHLPIHHHSSPQDSVIEIIHQSQCYQIPFLDLSPSCDHFEMFLHDIYHKTGRSLTQQGIDKIIQNLKQFTLQKNQNNLQESICLKVSTSMNEDKRKTANSTIHSSKVQKTVINKQNIKVSRPSYQDAAQSKKQTIPKSRVISNLPRSRIQVAGITF